MTGAGLQSGGAGEDATESTEGGETGDSSRFASPWSTAKPWADRFFILGRSPSCVFPCLNMAARRSGLIAARGSAAPCSGGPAARLRRPWQLVRALAPHQPAEGTLALRRSTGPRRAEFAAGHKLRPPAEFIPVSPSSWRKMKCPLPPRVVHLPLRLRCLEELTGLVTGNRSARIRKYILLTKMLANHPVAYAGKSFQFCCP